jgi:protein-S-isoprenylcysteine O-methyltransferase Ste14
MKKRIKIDSSLLSAIIVLTGVLYFFPKLYIQNLWVDNLLDFFGFLFLFKGVLLRMFARGHKKSYSNKGGKLVTSGPYALVRNPMYLGSFLIGIGFVVMIWPLWFLPIFAWLFFLRFNKQVVKEEKFLTRLFKSEYETYCRKVPRIFPAWKKIKKIKHRDYFNWEQAFSTKEKRGLIAWPLLAIGLEYLQESFIFGGMDFGLTLVILIDAVIVFGLGTFILFRKK